jgi:hypothetical protein
MTQSQSQVTSLSANASLKLPLRFNSDTCTHFGRGRLQAEAVARRRASKAVLGSPGAAPASTQPDGRPRPTGARAEPLALAHTGDPCPESAEDTGFPAERSRRRMPSVGSRLVKSAPTVIVWCPSYAPQRRGFAEGGGVMQRPSGQCHLR